MPNYDFLVSTKEGTIIRLLNTLATPRFFVPSEKLNDLLVEYRNLIVSFKDSINIIKSYLRNNYLFLMTDKTGVLIAKYGKVEFEDGLIELRLGASFAENSCGPNAISLAIKLKKPVILLPSTYPQGCPSSLFYYSVPLVINKKNTICYLMVCSSINIVVSEIITITQLLKDRIIDKYSNSCNPKKDKKIGFTEKQQLILELLSKGMTTQAIALELGVSPNTVKYYKKKIFKILDVQSTSAAIAKAIRYQIIKP